MRALLVSVTVLSPASTPASAVSNDMVGHAARVHAKAGPAVSVCPESVNVPLHTLQSSRADKRPSVNVTL